jgi:hypothetical protein
MYNMDETHTTNTTNIQSTTFIDQAPVLPAATHMTGDNISNETATAVTDQSWDLKSLMDKPTFLTTLNWTSTTVSGTHTTVSAVPPPPTATLGRSHKDLLRAMFLYHKLDIIFRFVTNGTKYHFGRQYLWFNPLNQLSIDATAPIYNTSIFRISGMPHALIDPSTSSTVELVIPYTHFRHLIPNRGDDTTLNFGSLIATPLTPLAYATGSTDPIKISVYWYTRNAQFHLPIPTNYPLPQGLESMLSAAADIGGKVLSGTPAGAALDTAGRIGKAFAANRDRPSTSGSELVHRTSTISAHTYLKGPDASTRLAVWPNTETTIDPSIINANAPETQIRNIISRSMLYDVFTLNSGDTSIVYSSNVYPTMRKPRGLVGASLFAYESTYLSYVAETFLFWKGTIELRFEFIKSMFHVGRYIVIFFPETPADRQPTGLTINDLEWLTTLPHAVIDLAESSVVDFSIPYMASTPYKMIPALSELTTTSGFQDRRTDYINGSFAVMPLNPLVTTLGMPPTIPVLVYLRAGPDFELYVPRHPTAYPLLPLSEDAGEIPTAQNDDPQQESSTTEPSGDTLNAGPSVTTSPASAFIGETVTDILDMCRRFNRVVRESLPPTNGMNIPKFYAFNVNMLDATNSSDGSGTASSLIDQGMNLSSYFSIMYLGYRGSFRYKFVTDAPRSCKGILTATHIPNPMEYREVDWLQLAIAGGEQRFSCMTSNYANVTTNLAHSPALEIEIPFYSIYDFLLRPDAYGATLPGTPNPDSPMLRNPTFLDQGYVVLDYFFIIPDTPTTNITIDIYRAIGDDFNFTFLLAPPPVFGSVISAWYNPTWVSPPTRMPAAQNDTPIKLILNDSSSRKLYNHPFDHRFHKITGPLHSRFARRQVSTTKRVAKHKQHEQHEQWIRMTKSSLNLAN